jgi:hypothetical protein
VKRDKAVIHGFLRLPNQRLLVNRNFLDRIASDQSPEKVFFFFLNTVLLCDMRRFYAEATLVTRCYNYNTYLLLLNVTHMHMLEGENSNTSVIQQRLL